MGLLLVALVCLAACDLSGAPTPVPTVDPLAQALSEIPAAPAINIRDDWAGLSKSSPQLAHYLLDRTVDGLTGTAEFSAGTEPVTTTAEITIPESVVQDFLGKLAAVPLKEGIYTPKIDHTDDSPNISITIQVDSGIVSFYSQSQGDDHLPWGASIANKIYVIDTPDVAQALALLEPYLKKDVLQQVIDEAANR